MTIAGPSILNAEGVPPHDGGDTGAGFRNARIMVRALADTLPDRERLQPAQAFGRKLVPSWWEACCLERKTRSIWQFCKYSAD